MSIKIVDAKKEKVVEKKGVVYDEHGDIVGVLIPHNEKSRDLRRLMKAKYVELEVDFLITKLTNTMLYHDCPELQEIVPRLKEIKNKYQLERMSFEKKIGSDKSLFLDVKTDSFKRTVNHYNATKNDNVLEGVVELADELEELYDLTE